jgi:multisubunit Na+/H+ antiporter MnhF subunit
MAALTPIAVAGLGLSQTLTWQLSALTFLALIGCLIGNSVVSYKTVKGSFPPDRLAACIALVLAVPVNFALFSILFSATASHHTFYVAALIGTLGQASFVFLRLVESTFTSIVYKATTAASTL